jgi:four helix bundle protein
MQKEKRYDLEDRTLAFARTVRAFVKALPKSISNQEDARQVARASGSVGANYIEANEALGKKDFLLRLKISRKEAKESRYWLRLLDTGAGAGLQKDRDGLIQEATELMNIFGSIIRKSE